VVRRRSGFSCAVAPALPRCVCAACACVCPQTHRYCSRVEALLAGEARGKRLVHVCGPSHHKRANAALLACCFAVMCRGASPEEAFRAFMGALQSARAVFGCDLVVVGGGGAHVRPGVRRGCECVWGCCSFYC
jgi:hypothetical protein